MAIKLQERKQEILSLPKTNVGQALPRFRKTNFANELRILSGCAVGGAVLGLSAPGFNEWYLAWCGLIPLFLFVLKSDTAIKAAVRSCVFGVFYNIVYLNWFLTLKPAWAIALPQFPVLTGMWWLLFCALHQGMIFAAFGFIVRKIPLASGFGASFGPGGLRWPSCIVIPLLWVLLMNKIGNSYLFMGIPWSMIEYSQYEQTTFIQIAQWIGGIGIGALIVMFNVAATSLILTILEWKKSKSRFKFTPHPELLDTGSFARPDQSSSDRQFAYSSWSTAFAHSALVVAMIGLCCLYGQLKPESSNSATKLTNVSLLQGNASMKLDNISGWDLAILYVGLSRQAPQGLCIWPEWSVPFDVPNQPDLLDLLSKFTARQHQSWLIGSVEYDGKGGAHNVVCAFDRVKGYVSPPYVKRLLVPFGEQLPSAITKAGLNQSISTCGPSQHEYHAGTKPGVFDLQEGKVGTVICLEVLSPEFICETVRAGAELIADSSNTVWFRSDMVGRQMIAFSVMRAAESSRAVVFTTTTGPSAIVDTHGKILKTTQAHKAQMCSGQVELRRELTPFTRWFR